MTWIRTVPLTEAAESLRRAIQEQRQTYPPDTRRLDGLGVGRE